MAAYTLKMYLIVLELILVFYVKAQEINNMLEYTLVEEDPGRIIANIQQDSGIHQLYNPVELQDISYRFLSQNALHQDKFEISTNGILRATTSLDRDAICGHSITCDLQFDIATEPREYFHIIKVTIHVTDVNDNSPVFEENELTLMISETTVAGTTFALPSAFDADIGEYGIQSFALEPQLPNFALDANINPTGSLDLHLILASKVDREINPRYFLRVIAWDGGNPVKSGMLNIDIIITDSNDNNPKFSNDTYQVNINENIGIDQTIFRVLANDADEGPNGEVTYEFVRSTENSFGHLFGIESSTGNIFTKAEIDYEEQDVYMLSIVAKDNGTPRLSSYTKLHVIVNDLNDNAPEITVNALHGSHAEIPENSALNAFVAHIVVKDKDSGLNGQFNCSMSSELFTLAHLYGNEYQILTRSVFDREVQAEYSVQLTCVDRGVMTSQMTSREIPVYITDTNDNTPQFNSDRYSVSVDEQNSLLAYIATITATDADINDNALLTYTIQQTNPVPTRNVETLTIDSKLGIIYANIVFDHEDISEYTFVVKATDNGSPEAKSSSTELLLIIEDINDEAPEFTQKKYTFGTYENQAPNTEIGTLVARDKDASPQFREINFGLDPRFTDVSTFDIDPVSGKIVTKKVLDREMKAEHSLLVVAFNAGYSLSDSTNVTVHVADKNDNAPIIHFPTPSNNTIEIKGNQEIDTVVAQISATDLDTLNNAALFYSIVYGNEAGYFQTEAILGEVTLTRQLEEETWNQVIELVILVEDGGNPSLSATETLNIFINGTFPEAAVSKQNKKDSKNDIAIIIICVLVFAIICILLLLFTLFFLRKRSFQSCHGNEEQPKYCCRYDNNKNKPLDMSVSSEYNEVTRVPAGSVSYITGQESSDQSIYHQRLPAHSAVVDGFCPAGTLVNASPRINVAKTHPHSQHAQGHERDDSDGDSLPDSGKGSSEGFDAIHRVSPLANIRKLPMVQKAGFVRDNNCSIYKSDGMPPRLDARQPYQTYLTDDPHTTSCRLSPDRGIEPNKKTVHFEDRTNSDTSHEVTNKPVNYTGSNEDYRTMQYEMPISAPNNDFAQHLQNVPGRSYPTKQDRTNGFEHKLEPHRPFMFDSSRQVVNLKQYLNHNDRNSDCESLDGYSGGSTTTSGSYAMDEDEDLAHDVLV